MKRKIALEGPINKCTDAQAKDWREMAKSRLGDVYDFHDPMTFDCRGREEEMGDALVRFDEIGMTSSDFSLVNAETPGWGTGIGIQYMFSLHRPIFAVCSSDRPSPWLVRRSTKIFKTFDDAFAHLRSLTPTTPTT
jgi:hypothetical protein